MALKSTKKPKKFVGIVPALIVLLCGGIIFLYGGSFSERVLNLTSFNSPSSDYTEGYLEERVKGYEITMQETDKEEQDEAEVAQEIEIPEVVSPKMEEEKEEDPVVVVEEPEVEEAKQDPVSEATKDDENKEESTEEEPAEDEEDEATEEEEEEEEDADSSKTVMGEEESEQKEDYDGDDQGDEHDYDDVEESTPKVEDGNSDSAEYDEYEDEEAEKTLRVSDKVMSEDEYEDDAEDGDEKVHSPPKTISDEEYEYEEEMEATSTSKDQEDEEEDDVDGGDDSGEKFLRVLEDCRDLICIQEAHEKYPRSSKMFNFPHFMIIGFQKAATTSLKKYLEKHSHISKPRVKEPNFFPYDCHEKPPEKCSRANTTAYITKTLHLQDYIDAKGEMAMFEASTHIVRAGHNLAPRMAKLMPWLKIIVQFREPISRAASMMIHNKDVNGVGCLMKDSMGHCLLHHSQITEMPTKRYHPITYTEAIKPWIESFPKEQIHVIQYEALTDDEREASELLRVREFLGVNTDEPKGGLGLANSRRFRINPEGWQLQRSQYEELVDIVKPDVESLVELLYEHDLIDDKDSWKEIWQAHWDENMKTCDNEKNRCKISLSR